MSLEKNIASYIKEKAINLSKMSRQTGISYTALYDSLFNKDKNRQLRGRELVAICVFLGVNPMDFAEKPEEPEKEVK